MKKVLILADQPGWCFDRRARALQEYAPAGWDVRVEYFGLCEISDLPFESADLIFLLDPQKAKNYRSYFNAAGIKIPLVCAHNSGTGRPGYSMDETLAAADWVIVNNHAAWAANRWGQRDYRAVNISNGVCLKTFRNETPWGDRPNRALWIGSPAKAEDRGDVKRYQSVLLPLSAVLAVRTGISPDFRTATPTGGMDDAGMRDWYNGGRYLVCASKSEGTPNIGLEGAACGCVVVSTPVGNIPELIVNGRNGKIVHRPDTVGFLDAFEFTPQENFAEMAGRISESIKSWDWAVRAPWYYTFWDALICGRPVKTFTYLNCPPEAVGK